MEIGWICLCLQWKKILHLICKTFEFIMYEDRSLVLVWSNSGVLFTWEINLRLCDDYYPTTDAWTNTQKLYTHRAEGAHAQRQISEHVFADLEYKHTQYACAQSTYLHTLIENWQTQSPTCHITTMYAHFLEWNVLPRLWKYAFYLTVKVIINCTLAYLEKIRLVR